jgi:hypothetical protein
MWSFSPNPGKLMSTAMENAIKRHTLRTWNAIYANGLITSRYNVILFFAILVVDYLCSCLMLNFVRLLMPLVSQKLHTH